MIQQNPSSWCWISFGQPEFVFSAFIWFWTLTLAKLWNVKLLLPQGWPAVVKISTWRLFYNQVPKKKKKKWETWIYRVVVSLLGGSNLKSLKLIWAWVINSNKFPLCWPSGNAKINTRERRTKKKIKRIWHLMC